MRLSVAIAVACLSIAGLSAAADVKAAIRRTTEIPAQGLGPALQMLAKEHGFQIVYVSDEVNSLRTQGASGEMTSEEALTRLLYGTGLTFRSFGDNGVSIVPVSRASSSSDAGAMNRAPESPAWLHDLRLAQVDEGPGAPSSSPQDAHALERYQQQVSTLEEVVVTAQKRAERLIEVPQSVSVLSVDDLGKGGATQFRDYADTVAGLSLKTLGAGVTQVSLRGVTTGFDIGPTVAIYIDDVPYGSSSAFADGSQRALDLALFDLERIEVLRGPQGTLYGSSAIGGLIKYVTVGPDMEQFAGSARTGLSSTRDGSLNYNGVLSVNAPLVEGKLAARASGFYSRNGGFIDNVTLGRDDIDRSETYGGRVDFLLTPTESLSLRLAALLQNISRDGESTANFSLAGTPLDGSLEQRRVLPEPFDQRLRIFSGTVTYDLGSAELTSISGYQTSRVQAYFDGSAVYSGFCVFQGDTCGGAGVPSGSDTDKFTQEVRLASQGDASIQWLGGLFYTHEKSKRNLAFDLRDLSLQPIPNELYNLSAPSTYEEYAVFGDLTYRLTEQFDVTGGLRYANNRQSYTQNASGLFIGPLPTHRSEEDVVTYLANVRYHMSEHATAYVRYATGYQPGGPNLVPRDPITGEPIAPETFDAGRLKSYEIGYKAESAERRFAIDVAAYYIEWSDIQVQAAVNGFGYFANAPGGATVKGMELSLRATPVDAFTMNGALAYQDARMSEADPDLQAAEHERLPGVPRFTATLNAEYGLSAAWQPKLGATLRHVTKRNSSFDGSLTFPQYHLPEYTVVDVRAGFTVQAVDAQFYVNNVFDERGQMSAYTQFGPPRVAIVPARTFGVSLSTRF